MHGTITSSHIVAISVLGLILGSFLGQVVRATDRKRFHMGRSQCEGCGSKLTLIDLVPLMSFLVLRGSCRSCGDAISRTHILAESLALAVALGTALLAPPSLGVTLALGWTLVLLAAFDADRFLLPLPLTVAVLVGGLLWQAELSRGWPSAAIAGALAGAGSLFVVSAAYRWLRGRSGLGGGDIILFSGAGAWVGILGLPWVAAAAAIAGVGVTVVLAAFGGRRLTGSFRVPFGAYLACATWVVFLFEHSALQPVL